MKTITKFSFPKVNKLFYYLFDFLFLIIAIILSFFNVNLFIVGWFIIIVSIYQLIKCRNSKYIILVFLLSYINVCIAIGNIFNYTTLPLWQQNALLSTDYNIIGIQVITIFIAIFNVFLYHSNTKEKVIINVRDNYLIFYLFLIISIFFLIYGVNYYIRNSVTDEYVSMTNSSYEYIPVFILLAWYFAGKNKYKKAIIFFVLILYSSIPLFYGDRSAAILGILLLYFIFFKDKMNVVITLLVILVFLLLFNFIGIYRNGTIGFFDAISQAFSNGLTSNTISYSYYTGTTIIALKNEVNLSYGAYFIRFLQSLFLGGSVENSNLALISKNYYYHLGGGIMPMYFYGYFGIIGVVTGSAIVGFLIRFISKKDTNISKLLIITITIYAYRWYVYGPTAFFRSAIIVPVFVIIIAFLLNVLLSQEHRLISISEF